MWWWMISPFYDNNYDLSKFWIHEVKCQHLSVTYLCSCLSRVFFINLFAHKSGTRTFIVTVKKFRLFYIVRLLRISVNMSIQFYCFDLVWLTSFWLVERRPDHFFVQFCPLLRPPSLSSSSCTWNLCSMCYFLNLLSKCSLVFSLCVFSFFFCCAL